MPNYKPVAQNMELEGIPNNQVEDEKLLEIHKQIDELKRENPNPTPEQTEQIQLLEKDLNEIESINNDVKELQKEQAEKMEIIEDTEPNAMNTTQNTRVSKNKEYQALRNEDEEGKQKKCAIM